MVNSALQAITLLISVNLGITLSDIETYDQKTRISFTREGSS